MGWRIWISNPDNDQDYLSFPKVHNPSWPTHISIKWSTLLLSGCTRLGFEAEHSSPSTAKVTNDWSWTTIALTFILSERRMRWASRMVCTGLNICQIIKGFSETKPQITTRNTEIVIRFCFCISEMWSLIIAVSNIRNMWLLRLHTLLCIGGLFHCYVLQ